MPPMMGPMMPPIGRIEVNMPTARSRSSPKWSETIPVADGMNAPPPRAWVKRGSSSSQMLPAKPQHSEEAVNTAAEIRKTVLRPYMSLILPASGMATTWPSA